MKIRSIHTVKKYTFSHFYLHIFSEIVLISCTRNVASLGSFTASKNANVCIFKEYRRNLNLKKGNKGNKKCTFFAVFHYEKATVLAYMNSKLRLHNRFLK